jgi:outer membrane protein
MVRPHVLPALLVCYGLVAQTPAPAPAPTAAASAAAPENVQRLSLQEAIKISLLNNLQVEIAKETRNANQAGVLLAQGNFDWLLTANASTGRQDSASTGQAYVGGPTNSQESTTWSRQLDVAVQKPFEWGGNLKVEYSPVYYHRSGLFLNEPTLGQNTPFDSGLLNYSGAVSATYTQSLLSGFGRKATEVNVIVAKKSSQIADYQFQQSIITLVATTESQYWDLVYAQRNLDNAKQALALAQKQLNENRIRVEVGTLAPIEVTSAEAAVALQEQNIITAEAALLNANDALIRALYPKVEHPDKLAPTEEPSSVTYTKVDEPTGEKMALEHRVELKAAKLSLESSAAQRAAAENRVRPKLDAFATYNGSSNNYDRLGPVNSDLTGSKYPGYVVGLNFSLPITNRSARGTLNQARANQRSSELSLKDQELAILLNVRQAFRNVEALEKGVEAAKKTRVFREKDLDAEQKKFENGMSTNFLVLSKQNDLDASRSAELQAQINFAKSVTALEQAMGNLLEARNLALPK